MRVCDGRPMKHLRCLGLLDIYIYCFFDITVSHTYMQRYNSQSFMSFHQCLNFCAMDCLYSLLSVKFLLTLHILQLQTLVVIRKVLVCTYAMACQSYEFKTGSEYGMF